METKLVEREAGVHEDAMRAEGAEDAMGLPSVVRAELVEDLQGAGIPNWCTDSAPGALRTPTHTDSKSAARLVVDLPPLQKRAAPQWDSPCSRQSRYGLLSAPPAKGQP